MVFGRWKRRQADAPASRELGAPSTKPGERIYAIGDIHGRYDLLRDLLVKIEEHNKSLPPAVATHLIVLGDMIDRGPQSAEVLKYLHGVQSRTEGLVVLMGNHEEMMLRAMQKEPGMLRTWMRFGGSSTLRSLGLSLPTDETDPIRFGRELADAVPTQWVEWLKNLPLMARSGDYLFCHAGIRPGVNLRKQSRQDLLWIRNEFLDDEDSSEGVVVVHGHSISAEVEMRSHRIGIDTGAYKTGVLTALYLENRERAILSTSGLTREQLAAQKLAGVTRRQEGQPEGVRAEGVRP